MASLFETHVSSYYQKNLMKEIHKALTKKESANYGKISVISEGSREARVHACTMSLGQLWQMGYRVQSIANLKAQHIEVLVARWDEEGISAATLHNRLCHLRVLCRRHGKTGVVFDPTHYLPRQRVQRTGVAKQDRSMDSKHDVQLILAKAREMDQTFGLMLLLQHHFGLRVRESIEFRPEHNLIQSGAGYVLHVHEGTKGGRPRIVPVDSDARLQAIAAVQDLVRNRRSNRMRWPELSYRQARRRFYHLATKIGLTREGLGTAHQFRHGYANSGFSGLAGQPSPVQGGDPKKISHEQDRLARITVSNWLGHSRVQATASYCGSHGHALRGTVNVWPNIKTKIWF